MSNTSETATAARKHQPESNQEEEMQPATGAEEMAGPITTQTGDAEQLSAQEKPDVSDQDYPELLPKLMGYFNNSREELARALGLHRSTVDRWLNNTSRPNNSTVLRMRRLAQERGIE